MTQAIQQFLQGFLGAPGVVFILSLLPVSEIRGGLIAARIMGMDIVPAFLISYIGNMLPIPVILLFLKKVFAWLKRFPKLGRLIERLQSRAAKKSKKIDTYKLWGLFVLVAIPLPGTGAWTGALVADFLDMPMHKSLPAIAAGVFAAGLIVSALMYLVPSLFGI